MISLFRAGWQLVKVRGMMWLALVCGAGSFWWGLDLAQHYGLNPGDGGVLAPLAARLAWAITVWLLGLAFLVGMWIYGRCYVAKIDYDEQKNQLHISTTGFLLHSRHIVDMENVRLGRYHDGRLDVMRIGVDGPIPTWSTMSVNAPWQSLRVAGFPLPLILDLQGETDHPELLEKLFFPKPPRKRGRSVQA
jgi:hypothetical protein